MQRRSLLKVLVSFLLTSGGIFRGKSAMAKWLQEVPLYSSSKKSGNIVFTAGKIANFDGDISEHTRFVLDEMEKELQKVGSSMEKVLKTTVYLVDKADFAAMNEVYRGRFGKTPPARTTVIVKELVGITRIEIDCVASI